MPASSSENFVHIEETLKSSLHGAQKVDSQIVSSAKRVLLNKIDFKPAQKAYSLQIETLRSKYIPLNPSQSTQSGDHEKATKPKMNGKSDGSTDGLPNPKTVVYPPEKIKLEWRRVHKIGSGLINMGNTCFLNSILQCLTYTPPLVNYFLSDEHSQTCKQAGFCMMCELQRHIKRCYENSGNAIKPQAILQKLRMIAKHMHWGRQEDAHEFLRYVVDAMQRSSLNGYIKLDKFSKETTVVNQIFGGFLRSQVQCLVCKEKSDTYDPFLDISLEIKSVQSLERAFERYVQPETLDNENAYMCTKCKKKVPAQKRFSVHKPPNVLTISLKRFDYHKMMGKVSRHIQFPEKLNLRPYMSIKQGEPVFYNLYAVLVHSGYACNSGHYYCYVKSPSKVWHCMNDSLVQQCSAGRVMNSEAYLLFYIKSKPFMSSHQSNGPLIGPKLPANHTINKSSKLVNGLTSFPVNELGSPLLRKQTSATVIGPQQPASSNYNQNSKPLPSNRDKVAFGLNPSSTKTQQPGSVDNKPRIVMQIKNGKVTTFEKSPNGKSKIVSGSDKLKSKLVPYGDDSDSEMENTGVSVRKEKNGVLSKNLFHSGNEKKKDAGEVIFDKKLNTTTSVPGNANLLETSSKQKADHTFSPNRRIDGLNLMGHKTKVSPHKNIDKTKTFCDTSGILCVSAVNSKLKPNSTDAKWLVINQDCAPSPSIGSNSSKDSVNSTSEWHVKDASFSPVPKLPDRQHPGWKVQNQFSSQEESTCNKEPSTLTCRKTTKDSMTSVENDYNSKDSSIHTDHLSKGNAESDLSNTLGGLINHVYSEKSKSSSNRKDDRSVENYECDDTNVSEKASLLSEHFDDRNTEGHKLKKHKKHKKHKKEYKYQKLLNESCSSTDVPVKKHKKKKHKHKKDKDNDLEDRRERKRKNNDDITIAAKRSKSDEESDEKEFVWVEKTSRANDEKKVPVQSWDHHVKDGYKKERNGVMDSHHTWDGSKSSKVVEELEKHSSTLGFGASVSSWDGGKSIIDQDVEKDREKERKRQWADHYDDELDMGKTKKIKKHNSDHNVYGYNVFQKAQDFRNEEKHKWKSESSVQGSHSFPGHNRSYHGSQGHYHHHSDYRNRDDKHSYHRGSSKHSNFVRR